MELADSVFMFLATILVWGMTPGIALFYGGMVSRKNVISTTMQSFGALAIVSILWVVCVYSLSFSTTGNALIGNFQWAFLDHVTFEPNGDYSSTIPHNLFMMFQMTFAVLTTAIISGGIAERMRFGPFLVFITMWMVLIYAPVAHWVWGVGGWLRELGALDFAGGNVVHISSGVAGLVLAVVVGKRKGNNGMPHSLPLTALGGTLIWMGWYGFNVGSALTLDSIAMVAFVNTAVAAAAGMMGWVLFQWMIMKKPTLFGALSGALAGLIGITPGAGFVTVGAAIAIGFIAGLVCFFGVTCLKAKLRYDDALDAFGLHGIGGTWGGLATGLFATTAVNENGANGLFYGDPSLLWKQAVAIIATYLFVGIGSYIIIKVIKWFMPVRANVEEEEKGLDLSFHGEQAYSE